MATKVDTSQLTANSLPFYFDYQNGEYGYNTSPLRGADTFSPFKKGLGSFSFSISDSLLSGYHTTLYTANVRTNVTVTGSGGKRNSAYPRFTVNDTVVLNMNGSVNWTYILEVGDRLKLLGGGGNLSNTSMYSTNFPSVSLTFTFTFI